MKRASSALNKLRPVAVLGSDDLQVALMELTVAITRASGSIYAYRTLLHLAASAVVERINLILSESAETVARVELGIDLRGADNRKINEWLGLNPDSKLIQRQRLDNVAAKPASGSHP